MSHLKITSADKGAIKALDRSIPADVEDLAIAAGIEATIPSR